MKKEKVAVIFAGGKSSRMGEDKSLLPFGGFASMSAFQYHKLTQIFDTVYISAKTHKFDFQAPLILDNYPQSSPLVGIVSVFETIEASEVFVLSVDAPFVDKGVISKLFEQNGAFDAVIAQSPSGVQPLCGIYKRSLLPKAKEFLDCNNHKLNALLDSVGTCFVAFEEDKKFCNLNYFDEYQEALGVV
ncbi:MAG: molybdenum cofactor guanylyltransferase MobA [Campylobacterales bacterium]|nr:molybdenum cofactor guanylyltransferase MobA [Campylobacterales bacterium]